MNSRINYLDGLRGLACIIVVFSHYLFAFYPAAHLGDPAVSHSAVDLFFARTPLNLFYNGNYGVCIFFVLSGFVLSYNYFKDKKIETIRSLSIRRLPRLLIPVSVSIIFGYIFLKIGLFSNIPTSEVTLSTFWFRNLFNFEPGIFEMMRHIFINTFFLDGTHYNPALWTMKYELYGSFLIFAFLALFGEFKYRQFVYLILTIIFFNTYYVAFLFGVIISDIKTNKKSSNIVFRPSILLVTFLLAIFLGSYPYQELSEFNATLYSFLNFRALNVEFYSFYHIIGATLLVFTVVYSPFLQKILSSKQIQFLGKISFSIYLTHLLILCSFSSYLFLNLIPLFPQSYSLVFLIVLIPSLLLIILISYLMNKIDLYGIQISHKLYKLSKKTKHSNH